MAEPEFEYNPKTFWDRIQWIFVPALMFSGIFIFSVGFANVATSPEFRWGLLGSVGLLLAMIGLIWLERTTGRDRERNRWLRKVSNDRWAEAERMHRG